MGGRAAGMRVHYSKALLHSIAIVPAVAESACSATAAAGSPTDGGGPSFLQKAAYVGAQRLRSRDSAALQTLSGEAMGTTWRVRLVNPRFMALEPIQVAIEEALELVVRQMSNWQSDSDISCFNRAPAGTWQRLPDEFFAVLSCALKWASASEGALDPTVGGLVQLWGFGPQPASASLSSDAARKTAVPSAQALQAVRTGMGYQRIELMPATQAAFQPGSAQLDFSGIAKGFSVDLVARRLKSCGLTDFLVEVGGELLACGQRPEGLPWRVAVADPAGREPRTVALKNMAIATSGDYWHVFEHAGRRYSHTIDPRTGEPVCNALASVTVLHPECMQADALATVLTVLGPQDGMAFAQAHRIAALFCERKEDGLLWRMSSAFEACEMG